MSLARFALSMAVCSAVGLSFVPVARAASSIANVTAPAPPGKPAEVWTVGTTPSVLTTAERLKLTLLEREWAARRTEPGGAAASTSIVPPGFLRPSFPFETRVPAMGLRDRTKPIQSAREIAEREKAGAR